VLRRRLATAAATPSIAGTPTFVVNGKLLPKTVSGWATLKPYLDGKAN